MAMDALNRYLSLNILECPLSFRRRVTLVLVTLLPTLLFLFEAIRSTASLTLAESAARPALERAVALDPANAALENQLGLAVVTGPEDADPAASLRYFRRAVELSPDQAPYWADLGSACEATRDFACADQALARALRLAPMVPRLYWITANYHLRRSQPETALSLFRKLLELDPQYAQPTFDVCLRVLNDPALIERQVLPGGKNPALGLAYAEFLSAQGESAAARQAWADAVRKGSRFQFSLVESYIERLIDSGQLEEAASAWSDLERLGVIGQPDNGNLVFNGGFEREPLQSGFDWRDSVASYVAVDFAEPASSQGRRCLRLDFMGTNADFEPVFQWVEVSSHQRYLLTAEARSESISSDSGPRLRVVDAGCPACLDAASDTVVGSTPWHRLSIEFETGSQTRLVKLSIWRPHSRTFPTEITGHFWLDAVRLTAEPVPAIASLKPVP
ncbi:MAG TPA: tetratricopeptide repeat protein [Terriglobia bacterium]|nr:tetratricopeptide repeat protein [Terriglobia bacterium]